MATRKPSAKPPKPLRRPATLDHLRKKEPREQRLAVVTSDSAAAYYEEAQEKARLARTTEERAAADAEVAAARAEVDEYTVWITVRSIGRRAYENLVRAHPPTDAQAAEFKQINEDATLRWNPETFPPALVAACMVEPAVSTAEATDLLDDWNVEESARLLMACETVCQRSREVDLGKGFGPIPGS